MSEPALGNSIGWERRVMVAATQVERYVCFLAQSKQTRCRAKGAQVNS